MSLNPIPLFVCGVSRSGTTLLTSILDSHSKIFMCNELLSDPKLFVSSLLNLLNYNELVNEEFTFKKLLDGLGNAEDKYALKHLKYIYRTGIDVRILKKILFDFKKNYGDSLRNDNYRFKLGWEIVNKAFDSKKIELAGWKLAPTRAQSFKNFSSQSKYIYILRDPRAVVFSQLNMFDRDINLICTHWNKSIKAFYEFVENHPYDAKIIKYEDLVLNPDETIKELISFLKLNFENQLLNFQNLAPKAILYGHNNKKSLEKGIFKSSIEKWKNKLGIEQLLTIKEICNENFNKFYDDEISLQ